MTAGHADLVARRHDPRSNRPTRLDRPQKRNVDEVHRPGFANGGETRRQRRPSILGRPQRDVRSAGLEKLRRPPAPNAAADGEMGMQVEKPGDETMEVLHLRQKTAKSTLPPLGTELTGDSNPSYLDGNNSPSPLVEPKAADN
jgi:hypothetical protein